GGPRRWRDRRTTGRARSRRGAAPARLAGAVADRGAPGRRPRPRSSNLVREAREQLVDLRVQRAKAPRVLDDVIRERRRRAELLRLRIGRVLLLLARGELVERARIAGARAREGSLEAQVHRRLDSDESEPRELAEHRDLLGVANRVDERGSL